jgi:L-fucose isomerase-like protein
LEIIPVSDADLVQRLQKARDDAAVMQQAEQQTAALLSSANVALETERRFVVTSFVVLRVFQDLLKETGAANLGVANCMGALIRTIDTTPCLVLSLLNDAGFTAFCHTDYTHTPAGVLLRWISGKPSFVCNSHFPHHGMITLAHCSAPRKMNGKDLEPTKLMTHFESDYGAATKVEYSKDQPVTCIVPNLNCTKWYGFKGQIMASPAMDMCRSQMDVAIQGDWKRLLHELEGFHTIVTYGNYLREVGYALGKVGLGWANYSEDA